MGIKGEGSRGGKIIGHTKSGIPIYASQSHINMKGLAIAAAGVAVSLSSGRIGRVARKITGKKSFGTAAKFGSIFTGEAMAAGGSDAVIEDLHLEHDQAVKNVVAGSLGVLGAVSGLSKSRSIRKSVNSDYSFKIHGNPRMMRSTTVEVRHKASEALVGDFQFLNTSNDGLHSAYSVVGKEHRRKGIANHAYNMIEKSFGKSVTASKQQSPDAMSFWKDRKIKKITRVFR